MSTYDEAHYSRLRNIDAEELYNALLEAAQDIVGDDLPDEADEALSDVAHQVVKTLAIVHAPRCEECRIHFLPITSDDTKCVVCQLAALERQLGALAKIPNNRI